MRQVRGLRLRGQLRSQKACHSSGAAAKAPNSTKDATCSTFQRAPVFAAPGGATSTGVLYQGRNYVFGKRWGKQVATPHGFNHWWLKTDPDEGTGHWVSAYYLTHWGNDEATADAASVYWSV